MCTLYTLEKKGKYKSITEMAFYLDRLNAWKSVSDSQLVTNVPNRLYKAEHKEFSKVPCTSSASAKILAEMVLIQK